MEITRETIIKTLGKVVSENQEESFVVIGSTALTVVLGNALPLKVRLTTDIDLIPASLGQTSSEELKIFNILKEDIRNTWNKIHEELENRGVVCLKDIFPKLGSKKERGQ